MNILTVTLLAAGSALLAASMILASCWISARSNRRWWGCAWCGRWFCDNHRPVDRLPRGVTTHSHGVCADCFERETGEKFTPWKA